MTDQASHRDNIKKFYDEIDRYPMLCQSCGMCEGICPTKAVICSPDFAKQYVPHLDQEKCIGCMQCVNACPARINMSGQPSVIGPYYKILLCKSTNKEYMENGSSGGVVTALLKYGIENGFFEEAVTVSNVSSPVTAESVVTAAPESESGSKYIAAPLLRNFEKDCKAAYTALPCQAKAIRKQAPDAFVLGLFCSKLQTEDLIEYLLQKRHRSKSEIKEITYRKGVWPGRFSIAFKDGTEISYNYGRSVFSAAFNSYCFTSAGCLLCDDYFSQSADISFGDPWGCKQYDSEGYAGETVVIVRTPRGAELVEKALDAQVIESRSISLEEIVRGHIKEIYNKKTALIQRMEILAKKTSAMEGYDRASLINADSYRILNQYSVRNNWAKRKSAESYRRVFRISRGKLFLLRFAHAFLLAQRMKRGNNYRVYLDIARWEQLGKGAEDV